MVRQSPRKTKSQKVAAVEATHIKEEKAVTTTSSRGRKAVVTKTEVEVKKVVGKRKPAPAKDEDEEAEEEEAEEVKEEEEEEEEKKPAAKKRKTAGATKEAGAMSLAARTAATSLKKAMYIGAHVSGAGGVHNAIDNAASIGANSFALFLKSQRKWTSPPLETAAVEQFRARLAAHGYDAAQHILPHGSYLVNLAQADKAKAAQAYGNFVDDLRRCEALGIRLYNFHPGSAGGESKEAAVARIAAQLNRSHAETKTVVTVVENMCGSGNVVGSRFEELRDIIALVDDKSRVGVCIDTCHAFGAGYDLRTPEAFKETMDKFDEIVGLQYLKALHLNDSKAPFASHRDVHANIGTGFLGLRAFHSVMNYEPFQNIPIVLETPIDEKGADGKTVENRQVWADEIKLLESLVGMDPESPELAAKAEELQRRGAGERKKLQEQVDKKAAKDSGKGKGKRGGKK